MQTIAEKTRAIYHAQHARVAANEPAMRRFVGMFTHDYFGLDRSFFAAAKAVDVGCGNTAKLLLAMHHLGCRDITGTDLGSEFVAPTTSILESRGVKGVNLAPGNILDLPFPDGSFDFVACHGVLVHLSNLDEVQRGFSELARITKPGGYVYTVYGCVGGLIEDCIIPALRSYYRSNPAFRAAVDNVSPEHFHDVLAASQNGIAENEGQSIDLGLLKGLFDVDLCVTLQNVIQAPVRLAVDESMIRDMHEENGLTEPRRLRRYVKRQNIRKFFSPLHFDTENPYSRLLYGSGNLEFLGRKPIPPRR